MEDRMKIARVGALVLMAGALTSVVQASDEAPPSWKQLTSLVGDWEGRMGDGTATLSYRMISNGTALLETMNAPDSSDMVTVYHPDGDSLLMTHYCSLGNQSRMRASGLRDGALDFAYVDSTNVKSTGQHHMSRLVLTLAAPDRIVQEWTSIENGKSQTGRYEFTRKR
jgi:hypothetical protein